MEGESMLFMIFPHITHGSCWNQTADWTVMERGVETNEEDDEKETIAKARMIGRVVSQLNLVVDIPCLGWPEGERSTVEA